MSTTTAPDPVTEDESTPDASAGSAPGVHLTPPTRTPLEPTDLARRAAVAAGLAVVVLVLSLGVWDSAANPWLQWLLTTPAVLWAALPLHLEAFRGARRLQPTTDLLACLGTVLAWLWSTVTLLTGAGTEGHYFFGAAAVVTALLLGGRWLEARAQQWASADLTELRGLGAEGVAAQRIDSRTRATTEVVLPLTDLRVGDHFIVRPGERVAIDGRVVDGSSAIDTALVTGDPAPVDVRSGDLVHAGTINTSGRLVVEVTATGADTTHARIVDLVEGAQTGGSEAQQRADRLSALVVPVVLGLALIAFLAWWMGSGSASTAFGVALGILVAASPWTIALAVPTALLVGTTRGAQRGLLVAGPHVLEQARGVDTVVLDKTGTITTGDARVTDLAAAPGLHPAAVLTAAAAVESGSDHPIARAIVRRAHDKGIKVPAIRDFEALPGSGAVASIKDMRVTVGRADLFDEVPAELATLERPGTTVFVGWEGIARGALTVSDEVRETSGDAIRALRAEGLEVWLVSGDNEHHATTVAGQVGIEPEHVVADVRPQDKDDVIARLRDEGKVVAVVGDGHHDGAAVEAADLRVALGARSAAAETADVVLVHGDLASIPRAVHLCREILAVVRQNLGWGIAYNVVAVLLTLAGLLTPIAAGVAMTLAPLVVVASSLRLRRSGD